ncbi:hypothetical protein LWI28_019582 [Acer negundo]|uniref:Uncharacterized protein n=1 Tax=Acer negundo TaxID=4023 RepID=A0AAD5NNP7_ACENE|nr:hypothetical protein LWI28_019582 [Acer negundo]
MPDIDTPPDYDFDPPEADEDEPDPKQSKSDLFVKHMKKVRQEDGSYVVACNYWKHIQTKHPEADIRSRSQTQIPSIFHPGELVFILLGGLASRGILLTVSNWDRVEEGSRLSNEENDPMTSKELNEEPYEAKISCTIL